MYELVNTLAAVGPVAEATVSPEKNRKLLTLLYVPEPTPEPVPVTSVPTLGVVLARTLVPNWLVPVDDVHDGEQPAELIVCVPIGGMVFEPDVSVAPTSVIT